ncbi:MAG: hypothetical protein ABF264_01980 [Flavobacteriales bacterium]
MKINGFHSAKFLLVGFILLAHLSFSQEERIGSIQPLTKFIAKSNFRIPFSNSNPFFKETAKGVVQMSGSLNYSFVKNFYIGAGYDYTYFKLSEQKLNSSPNELLDAKIHLQGFYGEVSYFYSLYESIVFEANLLVGQETIQTSSAKCSLLGDSHEKKGLFWNPNINVYLLTEEVFSFYFSMGYRISSNGFKPSDVCETEFSGFESKDYNGNYGSFNIGFGIGFSFIKPDKN